MGDGQERAPFLEAIGDFVASRPSRFFVPGHKGGAGADPKLRELIGERAFELDVPQGIDGLDLNVSATPIQRAESLAAELYGADRSWLLTNGATQGNQALCVALAGERAVVLQRNSHTSVIDGLVLSGGRPHFARPEYDDELAMALCVTPGALADALAHARTQAGGANAAFIVSPTYYGATADVAACAQVCHDAGAALIVDQAWGPHFGFHPDLPPSALALGADAVLTSTHKICGSLTQSAMLHAVDSEWLDIERIARTVRLLRSTSASGLLMASLDGARRQLALAGTELLGDTLARGADARAQVAVVSGCGLVPRAGIAWASVSAWDPMRIVIDVRGTGGTGHQVAAALARRFNTHVELATPAVIVLVLGINEPPAPLAGFAEQLAAVVDDLPSGATAGAARAAAPPPGAASLTPREAWLAESERVDVERSIGRISAEAIAGYPPGIPTLLPGERVTAAIVAHLRELVQVGVQLHGASDPHFETIAVVVEAGA